MSDMHPDDELGTDRIDPELEADLHLALDARAGEIAPSHRLDTILEEAGGARSGVPKWLIGLVAAAGLLLLAITVPMLLGGDDDQPLVPGATTSVTETTAATETEEPTETATATEEPTDDETMPSDEEDGPEHEAGLAALPVYFVAHIGDDNRMARLHREWVNVEGVLSDSPVEDKLDAALEQALRANPPGTDGYLYTWEGVDLVEAEVSDSQITITLSGAGRSGMDEDESRVSVQQLVWTAQAVVSKGKVPVKFVIADGSTELFGLFSTSATFNRPATTDLYWEDLAPIWITSPTRGETIAGDNVVVTGDATVFEATVQWELIDAGTGDVKQSGFETATAGAPERGTYEIDLGSLSPGDYLIRVFELSMKDGTTVSAERTIPFSVSG